LEHFEYQCVLLVALYGQHLYGGQIYYFFNVLINEFVHKIEYSGNLKKG